MPSLIDRFQKVWLNVRGRIRNWLSTLHVILNYAGIPVTASERLLWSLKNKHIGKRCFIVGNGPSLRISDLDLLKDEITIASNKIYLAFGQTVWRPSYYSAIDTVVMGNISDKIQAIPCPKFFLKGTEALVGQAPFAMFCAQGTDWVDVNDFRPGFSADIRKKIFAGECVTYFNIQIAYYLGCREIYLVGVDFSFSLPMTKVPDKGFEYMLTCEGEQNHFIKNYRPVGEKWTMPHLKEQKIAFAFCEMFMRSHGGGVRNASRKTELDVFDRVDFETLFPSNK